MAIEPKTITLSTHAARRAASLKAGERLLLVEPVVPPPGEHWTLPVKLKMYHPRVERIIEEFEAVEEPGEEVYGFADEDEGWVSPVGQPGDVVWVKWKYDLPGRETLLEKLRIAEIDVRQVRTITEKEVPLTGIEPVDLGKVRAPHRGGFIQDWQSRHPDHPWPDGWAWFEWLEMEGSE